MRLRYVCAASPATLLLSFDSNLGGRRAIFSACFVARCRVVPHASRCVSFPHDQPCSRCMLTLHPAQSVLHCRYLPRLSASSRQELNSRLPRWDDSKQLLTLDYPPGRASIASVQNFQLAPQACRRRVLGSGVCAAWCCDVVRCGATPYSLGGKLFLDRLHALRCSTQVQSAPISTQPGSSSSRRARGSRASLVHGLLVTSPECVPALSSIYRPALSQTRSVPVFLLPFSILLPLWIHACVSP
jgi:hypothetical protein